MFSINKRSRVAVGLRSSFVALFLALAAINHSAAADETVNKSASITGVILDSVGTPASSTPVSLLDSSGSPIAETKTDAMGHYRITGVNPGNYTLSAGDSTLGVAQTAVQLIGGDLTQSTIRLESSAKIAPITVLAQRLDKARNSLSPSTGSSKYEFDRQAIKELPEGDSTSLNHVLLQAPGVANDSFGQLHIRGDHGNLQYRINNVIIPEGISGFGQVLDPRFANKIELLTGALPAQYGYRTAGVINITTRDKFEGGEVGIYGGSHTTVNPDFAYGTTTAGGSSAFVTGSYLDSGLGIESPTGDRNPIHDRTQQDKLFGYFSTLLTDTSRLSAILATSGGRFEIPNNPGQPPDPNFCSAPGQPANACSFDSANLNDRQRERTSYGLFALQGLMADVGSYQIALFDRVSSVNYQPDPLGDLVFNGVAATIHRQSSTYGLQGDASFPLGESHTLRVGTFISSEDDVSDNTSVVFPTDNAGNINGSAITIVDNNPKNGNFLAGLYIQDEWDLQDNLTINYGVRYDKLHAYVGGEQLSPRLGVLYYLTPDTAFHAGYARYFTPPPNELVSSSSIDKFANTTNAPSVTQNSTVKPESTHYFDVGVSEQFTSSLNVGLDVYYKLVRNLLDEGQFGQALIFTPFNYDQGRVRGVELTAAYHEGGFRANGNLSLAQALGKKISSGEFNFAQDELDYIANNYIHLDHDQKISGSGSVAYLWQGTTFSLADLFGSGLRRGGSVPNGDHIAFYNQIDVSAERMVKTGIVGDLDLRLSVINILDRSYEIRDGSGVGVGAPQFGPRAAVYFGIAKPFGGK